MRTEIVIALVGALVLIAIHRQTRKLDAIMALVSIEQGDLDSIASTVSDVADTLQGIIDSETPLDPADESALTAAVTKLQGVGPKVPPPVEPPVA